MCGAIVHIAFNPQGQITESKRRLFLDLSKALVSVIRGLLFRFPLDVPCPGEKVDILMRAGLSTVFVLKALRRRLRNSGPLADALVCSQDLLQQARALHDGALGVRCRLQRLSGHFSPVWARLTHDRAIQSSLSGAGLRKLESTQRCWLRAVVDDKRNDNRCIVD